MKLTLVQLDQTAGDVRGNLDRAERRVGDPAAAGADLVALPELFSVGDCAYSTGTPAAPTREHDDVAPEPSGAFIAEHR